MLCYDVYGTTGGLCLKVMFCGGLYLRGEIPELNYIWLFTFLINYYVEKSLHLCFRLLEYVYCIVQYV